MKRTALRSRPTRHCASCAAAGRTLCIHGKGPERRKAWKSDPKKKAENFREKFHSVEFVKWIHQFPCAHCEVYGWTEAAHVKRRSQGGKAPENIVPLCGTRTEGEGKLAVTVTGCHQRFDAYELEDHRMRFRALAKDLWRRFLETEGRSDD